MLFTQLNGKTGPVDHPEEELLATMACTIGPRVDGVRAAVALPQSMGAFVTAGAQGACAGRPQQMEQHTPILGVGLGAPLPASDYRSMACTGGQVWDDQLAKCVNPAPAGQSMTYGTNKVLTALQTNQPYQVYQAGSYTAPTAPSQPYTPTAPSTTTATAPGAYPAGTITAYSATRGGWRVAIPVVTGLGIFGGSATYREVALATTAPAGAVQVTESQFDQKIGNGPWYKNWKIWAAIGGGVLVLGGGYMLFRRKPASSASVHAA